MNILARPVSTVLPRPEPTLDELWEAAEQLGAVEVSKSSFGRDYSARIMFSNAGSLVFARASAKSPHAALEGAIAEACRMGARAGG